MQRLKRSKLKLDKGLGNNSASLVRNAGDATVVAVGNSKLGLEINGTVIKDRLGRIKFLQENAGVNVFVTKLGVG